VAFHSLLVDLSMECAHAYIPSALSTSVMLGGVVGAMLCGFAADTYGRRPAVIGASTPRWSCTCAASLVLVFLMNMGIALVGNVDWVLTMAILFVLGVACGGTAPECKARAQGTWS